MKLAIVSVLVSLAALGCLKKDPLYCDQDTPCTDPERPFCDNEGEYPASEGIKHTCIADPFGSSTDGGPTDDAEDGRAIVQLESGRFASCAVLSDGGLRCWGNLRYGELVGDDEDPRDAGDMETGGPIAEVAIGSKHICVLYGAGNVRCWGDNQLGILGYGHENPVDGPPANIGDVELGGAAKNITAGSNHTCALLESGDVRCWGYNTVGQLGLGHTQIVGDNEVPADEDPVDVGGVVLQMASGNAHTCVVLEGGLLRCWGQNGSTGKLGYGYESDVGDTETPAEAGYVNVGGDVVAVAPGENHTCALLEGGAVRCWGSSGSLGVPGNANDIGDSEDPATFGTTDIGGPARQIIAGDTFTCAAREDDELACWGGASSGRLGYGSADDHVGDNETPAQQGTVMLGGPVSHVSRGGGDREHSCALLRSGDVRCWGDNGSGQLGVRHLEDVGDDETPASEDPVQILD